MQIKFWQFFASSLSHTETWHLWTMMTSSEFSESCFVTDPIMDSEISWRKSIHCFHQRCVMLIFFIFQAPHPKKNSTSFFWHCGSSKFTFVTPTGSSVVSYSRYFCQKNVLHSRPSFSFLNSMPYLALRLLYHLLSTAKKNWLIRYLVKNKLNTAEAFSEMRL